MNAVRILVSGRVQGVGFRAWTRREATKLNLRGTAINLPDGRVEIHAEGDPDACDALLARLRDNATPGSVDAVDAVAAETTGSATFTVG